MRIVFWAIAFATMGKFGMLPKGDSLTGMLIVGMIIGGLFCFWQDLAELARKNKS